MRSSAGRKGHSGSSPRIGPNTTSAGRSRTATASSKPGCAGHRSSCAPDPPNWSARNSSRSSPSTRHCGAQDRSGPHRRIDPGPDLLYVNVRIARDHASSQAGITTAGSSRARSQAIRDILGDLMPHGASGNANASRNRRGTPSRPRNATVPTRRPRHIQHQSDPEGTFSCQRHALAYHTRKPEANRRATTGSASR
jgi:hypothetical protein